MATIKFDWATMYRDLTDVVMEVVDTMTGEIYQEATSALTSAGKTDSEQEAVTYDAVKQIVTGQCTFYAQALVESFGTGTEADTTGVSYWSQYIGMKDNDLFNPARTGTTIVGRPAGSYVDMWGRGRQSSGARVGQPLGIKGIKPKYSIQHAEEWIMKNSETKIERALETALDGFFANASKYFIVVGG